MNNQTYPNHSFALRTAVTPAEPPTITEVDGWRERLPNLTSQRVLLREMRPSDAPSLCALLTTREVQRFISPPPPDIPGFERFIARSRIQQRLGQLACFAITLRGQEPAIGIIQLRETEKPFATAEWGFALGSPFWGTGVFQEAAQLALEFAFKRLSVHRVEARASIRNGRGNRALLKLGAIQEGVLRKAFLKNNEYQDQVLYAVVEEDWRAARNGMVLINDRVH
jgi:ribosomal-protein-alanine N-acetyltransferase